MNNQCRYLGKKEETAYCRKPKTWTCPKGKISSCPCIPADFWNIAVTTKKDSQKETPSSNENAGKTELHAESADATTKTPVKQNARPVHIREISVFKSC